jgi:hypothetical protein
MRTSWAAGLFGVVCLGACVSNDSWAIRKEAATHEARSRRYEAEERYERAARERNKAARLYQQAEYREKRTYYY